ncbi:MAG: type VI secretion system-associated protein TagF [Anaeromyxobacter sp.]
MPLSASTGLFGKIPALGDFLRVNAAAAPAPALVEWLHAAQDALARAGGALPAGPIRFVLAGGAAPQALVGVLMPSRDKVGRTFPLCAFTGAPVSPGLHAACDAFAASAEALLAGAATQDAPALTAGLRGLAPLADATAAAAALAAEAGRRPAAELPGALFPELPAVAYALGTLQRAVRAPRVMADCPAPDACARWFWLELARRAAGVVPSCLWTAGRVLVAPGLPGPGALAALADAPRPPSDVWPLRTSAAAALQAALAGLPAAARAALETGTAATLLERLGATR